MCTYVFVTFECVYYRFCNVWVCVCMSFVMSGCVYVWVIYCAVVCMYGFCNVWVFVCMGFLMPGCVCIGFEMCRCVYV